MLVHRLRSRLVIKSTLVRACYGCRDVRWSVETNEARAVQICSQHPMNLISGLLIGGSFTDINDKITHRSLRDEEFIKTKK